MRNTVDFRLIFILALAIACRISIAFFSGLPWYSTDSADYLRMADAILSGHPVPYFPNGYPLIIVLVKLCSFGVDLGKCLLSLNCLLSMLSVWLVYQIGKKLNSEGVGLLAALALAVWPNHLNYVRFVLSEVSCTFFILLGVYLFLVKRLFLSAFAFYLAAMVRSTIFPVIPCVIILMLVFKTDKKLIYCFVFGALLAFSVDKGAQVEGYIRAPENLSMNLLVAIQSQSHGSINFNLEKYSNVQRDNALLTYVDFARDNFADFLRQRVLSVYELWGPYPSGGDEKTPRGMFSRLLIGLHFPIFVVSLLAVRARRQALEYWIVLAPILSITLVHMAFFSTPRFAVTVEPLALILSASYLFSFFATRRKPDSNVLRD